MLELKYLRGLHASYKTQLHESIQRLSEYTSRIEEMMPYLILPQDCEKIISTLQSAKHYIQGREQMICEVERILCLLSDCGWDSKFMDENEFISGCRALDEIASQLEATEKIEESIIPAIEKTYFFVKYPSEQLISKLKDEHQHFTALLDAIREFCANLHEMLNNLTNPAPLAPHTVVYAHIYAHGHIIVYEEGMLACGKFVPSLNEPRASTFVSISENDSDAISKFLNSYNYLALCSDVDEGCRGSIYNVFQCEYSDGKIFRYVARNSSFEFEQIYNFLASYCKFHASSEYHLKSLENISNPDAWLVRKSSRKIIPILGANFIIGSSMKSNYHIDGYPVKEPLAKIVRKSGGFFITAIDSLHHIEVNEKDTLPGVEVQLTNGMYVKFGSEKYEFHCKEAFNFRLSDMIMCDRCGYVRHRNKKFCPQCGSVTMVKVIKKSRPEDSEPQEVIAQQGIFEHIPSPKELGIVFTPVPVNPGQPEYIHVSSGHSITYEKGKIKYRNTINPSDAPLYANAPKSYFAEKTKRLSEAEIKTLYCKLNLIPLTPLYKAMQEDTFGAMPELFGASYDILEIRYSDGQEFCFSMHRSVPEEFNKIDALLSSFCDFEPGPLLSVESMKPSFMEKLTVFFKHKQRKRKTKRRFTK